MSLCSQFENVSKSKIFLSLPCVRVEVLNQTREEMSLVVGESVCQLVLEWIKRQCEDNAINMDQLTEKVGLMSARRLSDVTVLIVVGCVHIWV
jgi:influenza virus NS1A-binding protein